jgi:hypothetical protein
MDSGKSDFLARVEVNVLIMTEEHVGIACRRQDIAAPAVELIDKAI